MLCIAALTLCTVSCRDVTDADLPQKGTVQTEAQTEANSSQSTVGGVHTEAVTTETEIILDDSVSLSVGTIESYLKSKNLIQSGKFDVATKYVKPAHMANIIKNKINVPHPLLLLFIPLPSFHISSNNPFRLFPYTHSTQLRSYAYNRNTLQFL